MEKNKKLTKKKGKLKMKIFQEKCILNVKSGGTNYKTCLVLYKNHGKFYKVRGMDAYIMNMLFNYKVLNGDVCGFPDS